MKSRRLPLSIACLICLVLAAQPGRSAEAAPSFVIFLHGLWGSMDNLPDRGRAWLDSSPYPHYRKHQDASYLSGPAYRPIPQVYLKLGEGPSLGKLVIHPYWLMQHEFAYWARRVNKGAGWERIKIFQDWQALDAQTGGDGGPPAVGGVNLIYLKFDWRLDLPQVIRDYVNPLLSFIDRRWPGTEIHLIGHSLGGLVGRYAAASHPRRFSSLVSIGGTQYGVYEIGQELRGERSDYGGEWDREKS